MTATEKRLLVEEFVREERRRRGITTLPKAQPEFSCIAFGEFYNLLWRELLFAPESRWLLNDPEILDGVYREVERERRRKQFV